MAEGGGLLNLSRFPPGQTSNDLATLPRAFPANIRAVWEPVHNWNTQTPPRGGLVFSRVELR